MTPSSELDRLIASAPSPFSDSVLPNAFRDTPDVPEIHAEARERLCAAIAHCRREQVNALQVITGDPGEGKTHLLAWLRRRAEQSWSQADHPPLALAPIEPLRSVDRVFHHMLHETVRHLRRPLDGRTHADCAIDSPLDLILWRALLRVVRDLMQAPWVDAALSTQMASLAQHRAERFLAAFAELVAGAWRSIGDDLVVAAARLPELSGADLEVLQTVLRFPDPDRRADILEWLAGASLPDDRLSRIGTRLLLDDEDGAWRGLSTVLRLAQLADVTLVLAFDQVEGTERLGEDAVAGLMTALAEVFNAGGSALVVVFCQTQIWPRMRERAQQQARDRLDDQPMLVLRSLTPEHALALVELRMQRFWRGLNQTPASPLYPFDREQVLAEVRGANLRTPRAVLNHFRALLAGKRAAGDQSPRSAQELVRAKLASIADDEARKPPRLPEARAELAQGMLRESFKAAWVMGRRPSGARVEQVDQPRLRQRPAPGIRVTLERAGTRRRLYFEANNSTHGASVAAAARRLKAALRTGTAERVLLLRESALPLPPVARDLMAELTPHGAVLWLDDREMTPLATFEALLNAAAAGDIAVSESDARQIALEQIEPLPLLLDRAAAPVFDDRSARRPPAATDPSMLARVRRYLREQRAIETLPTLADRLELPIDAIHATVEALRVQGLIDLVQDRSRVQVALLRPEE